jgi:glycosyltransferase involved in cell wall biosynthesis
LAFFDEDMMQKYKILYINDWGDWGGAEKVTLTLIKSLNRERYEPYFILGSDGLFAQALQAEGVSVRFVPMTPMSVQDSQRYMFYVLMPLFLWRLAVYTLKCYLVARQIRPDLIQTCSIQAKLIGSFVARLLRVKLLWHVQNMQPVGFRRILVRFLAKRFPDMIVATSQAVADIYVGIVQPDKLKVIHAGLDLGEFALVNRAETQCSVMVELGLTDAKIVLYASMIRHWKGTHIFIRAAAEVFQHFPNVFFLIVGEAQFSKDDEYKAQLYELVQILGLTKKIKFLGFRRDVYRMIAAADCLVHCPVKSDPLPTVILEAMALQTPVIGTTIGGIPEEIDHYVTGLLVEPGDDTGLATAIIQILENPEMAKNFTEAARHKLETEFSHRLFVKKIETIYAQVLP